MPYCSSADRIYEMNETDMGIYVQRIERMKVQCIHDAWCLLDFQVADASNSYITFKLLLQWGAIKSKWSFSREILFGK